MGSLSVAGRKNDKSLVAAAGGAGGLSLLEWEAGWFTVMLAYPIPGALWGCRI